MSKDIKENLSKHTQNAIKREHRMGVDCLVAAACLAATPAFPPAFAGAIVALAESGRQAALQAKDIHNINKFQDLQCRETQEKLRNLLTMNKNQ